jgi:hypothetical protein
MLECSDAQTSQQANQYSVPGEMSFGIFSCYRNFDETFPLVLPETPARDRRGKIEISSTPMDFVILVSPAKISKIIFHIFTELAVFMRMHTSTRSEWGAKEEK